MKLKFKKIIRYLGIFIKKHRVKIIISSLSLVTAGAIATTVWALWFREAPVLNPDYAAKETEKNAEKIEGTDVPPADTDIPPEITDGQSSAVNTAAGGKASIIYSHYIKIDISEKKAELIIGNMEKSEHNIVVEVIVQDEVILQSGAIMPGYKVTKLDIPGSGVNMLRAGTYSGAIRLYLYDSKTNERELLFSEISAEISVVE